MKNTVKKLFRKHIQSRILQYKRRGEIEKFAGNGVLCQICQSEFKTFAPFGIGKRPNAKCPNCGSLERHRMLFSYMKEQTNLLDNNPKKLLHFAPEGMFQKLFRNHPSIQYFPVDLAPDKYGEDVAKADITAIPFEDETFDVILCSHVLEHVPDDGKAMRELLRVMKKDGWGIFQVPINEKLETTFEDPSITSPSARKKAYGRKDHVRWYGLDFGEKLKKIGFQVKVADLMKSSSPEEIFRFGYKGGEDIFHCRK